MVDKDVNMSSTEDLIRNKNAANNKPEAVRNCRILYLEEENPKECGGEVEKYSVYNRSEIRLGGSTPSPVDEFGVCNKCKVRTSW